MICEAILKIKSDAQVTVVGGDIDTCTITWHDDNPTNITKEQIKVKINETKYQRDRIYPPIEEQLDMQYWDNVNGTSTSYTAVSGMTLNITPAATSSKILLIHSANVQAGAGFYGYYTIYRDSTDISESHASRGLGSLYSSQGTQALPMHFSKLDSPSTTSQITYTVQFRSSNGSAMHYGEPDGTTTTLIAIEIGA